MWIETLTRDHKHRDLYLADAETGQSRQMLELSDDKFVDDNYDVWVDDGTIVLTNWTDGHNHLYLYCYDKDHPGAATAKLERQLTSGDFEVRRGLPRRSCKASRSTTRRTRATRWSSSSGR